MTSFITANLFLLIPLSGLALFLLILPWRDKVWEKRLSPDAPDGMRGQLYRESMMFLWTLALLCLMGWILSGRSFEAIGFIQPEGWRAWLSYAAVALALGYWIYCGLQVSLSPSTRQQIRHDLDQMEGANFIRPQTSKEQIGFTAISITAGITEEIIFRGFLIMTLALWMPLPIAAGISILAFTLAHFYQGPGGMVRVFGLSLILTALYLLTQSLWPVIAVHIIIDLTAGTVFAAVRRLDANPGTA